MFLYGCNVESPFAEDRIQNRNMSFQAYQRCIGSHGNDLFHRLITTCTLSDDWMETTISKVECIVYSK